MTKYGRCARSLSTLGVLTTIALLGACSAGTGGAPAATPGTDGLEEIDPISLRAAGPWPAASAAGSLLTTFIEEVEKRSDGKVTIEGYFDGTLVPQPESTAGLSSGLTDLGFFYPANQPSEFPVSSWVTQLAVPVTNLGFPMSNLAGLPASAGIFNSNEAVLEEMAGLNIRPLLHFYNSPPILVCTEPITTLAEAAGKTVTVGGEPWKSETTALGMQTVFLPPAEHYNALQRGVIDCAVSNADFLVSLGLTEVASAVMLLDLGASAGAQLGFNNDVWESLPDAVKDIMEDSAAAAEATFTKINLNKFKEAVELAEDAGMTFPDVSSLDEVIHQQRDEKLRELLSTPAQGIDDPRGIHEEYGAFADDWVQFVESELDVESLAPGEGSVDELIEAFSAGSDGIDWEAYEEQFAAFLSGLR